MCEWLSCIVVKMHGVKKMMFRLMLHQLWKLSAVSLTMLKQCNAVSVEHSLSMCIQ